MSDDAQFAITIDQLKHFAHDDPEARFLPTQSPAHSTRKNSDSSPWPLNGTVRVVTRPWSFAVKGKLRAMVGSA